MKILHVLNHSLPEVDGYSVRSHNILLHQRKCGLDVLAVTSPKQGKVTQPFEEIDGVRFYRTTSEEPQNGIRALPFLKEGLLILRLHKRILEVAQKEKVNVIHAHSPSLNGLPAYRVAHRMGIPVVYEMRTLWEEGPVDGQRTPFESVKFVTSQWIETQLFRRVPAISVISQGLKQDLVGRGIAATKISVFPNGVDLIRFTPTRVNEDLKRQLELDGRFIVGFVGSFSYWEGLELLVRAIADVVKQRPEIRFLFVGVDEKGQLKNLARSLHVKNFVTFTGRVTPSQILNYYSIIDLFVYPRKRMRLTELVTPLKPLEAMAMEKLILASDVGGHKELIRDGETGFLFQADNLADLVKKVLEIVASTRQLDRVRREARLSVLSTRNWQDIARHYGNFYEELLNSVNCRQRAYIL